MILGALSLLIPRSTIAISAGDRRSLEVNGPRALNYLLARGLRRAQARVWAVLRGFLLLAFGWWLGWSGEAMLAALIFLAVLTVALDLLRYALARRPIHYCQAREFRARQLLEVCVPVENGRSSRRVARPRPQPLWTLSAAVAATAILLPAVWLALEAMGVVVRDAVFEQLFLPVTLIVISGWRVLSTFQEILAARSTTPGSIDLFLDSDDALDTYAGVVIFSWIALFGSYGPLLIALAIQTGRLAYRALVWWRMREAVAMLAARVRRTHPNASVRATSPSSRDADDDWEEQDSSESLPDSVNS